MLEIKAISVFFCFFLENNQSKAGRKLSTCMIMCSRTEQHLVCLSSTDFLAHERKVAKTSKRALIHECYSLYLSTGCVWRAVDELISQGIRSTLLKALNFINACDWLQAATIHTHTHTLSQRNQFFCTWAPGGKKGQDDRNWSENLLSHGWPHLQQRCCMLLQSSGERCTLNWEAQRETQSLWLSDLEPSYLVLVCSTNTNASCVSCHGGRLHTGLQSFKMYLSPSKLVIDGVPVQIGML